MSLNWFGRTGSYPSCSRVGQDPKTPAHLTVVHASDLSGEPVYAQKPNGAHAGRLMRSKGVHPSDKVLVESIEVADHGCRSTLLNSLEKAEAR